MRVFIAAGRAVLNFIYLFHKLFPVKERISFISRQSNEPSDDIRLLAEEIGKLSPETEVVISCKMIGPGLPGKFKYLLHMISKQMHLFATSKAVILDGYCISACILKHKKGLRIYQMWHAMGALKKFGWASIGEEEGASLKLAKAMRMHKGYTTIFVSSRECKKQMSKAFGCSEEIMEVMPLPRTDLILSREYNEEIRRRIFEEYPQVKGKKIILYAPTFRKNTDIKPYVEELIGAVDHENYALIVKLHPLDKERITSDKAIIDPDFSSMQWLSCADHVVTDYSATVFEAALAGKPIYRYVPDMEGYDAGRGFLIDPDEEIPALVSRNADEIMQAVRQNIYDADAVKKFAEKYICAGEDNTGKMAEYIAGLL